MMQLVLLLVLVVLGLGLSVINTEGSEYRGNDVQEYLMKPEHYDLERREDLELDRYYLKRRNDDDWSRKWPGLYGSRRNYGRKPKGKTLSDKRRDHRRKAHVVQDFSIDRLREEVVDQ